MKVRWKQYEVILVTVAFTAFVLKYLWDHLGPQGAATFAADAKEFIRHHVYFNQFRNQFLPILAWMAVC